MNTTSQSIRRWTIMLTGVLLCGTMMSCMKERERQAANKPVQAPRIDSLAPASTPFGRGFSVQPNGDSAISVIGAGMQYGTRARFDNQVLDTRYVSETVVTVIVPPDMYAKVKTYQVTVENPEGSVSNAAVFSVFAATGPAPNISRLWPDQALAGKPFNVQPDGSAALGVEGSNFLPGAVIQFDGVALDTTFGSAKTLTGPVPVDLIKKPHMAKINIKNPDGKVSKAANFSIFAATGSAPLISRLWPEQAVAGKAFNVQPDGSAALGVHGSNFLPGAAIQFDGVTLNTAFGGSKALTGIVPADLIKKPHIANVTIKNPDGKTSKTVNFTIKAGP